MTQLFESKSAHWLNNAEFCFWYAAMAKMFRAAPEEGLVMEFGVGDGRTINELAEIAHPRIVYGFDSFAGLPEDWMDQQGAIHLRKGHFACSPPQTRANVSLVTGLFQESLPKFLKHYEKVAFVHVDSDLYSSALFVLNTLGKRLIGAIVVFDEIRGHPAYVYGEERALREFLGATGMKVELIGHQHGQGAGYRING